MAIAEGCTGGLVSALLTSVPGASDYLVRTVVPYSYDPLRTTMGVTREALDEHGAVSEPVVEALARRARDLSDATWGLATTGIAGPGGGSESDPIGTGYVAVARSAPWGSQASSVGSSRHTFEGNRNEIRERLARTALRSLLERVRDPNQ